MFHEKAGDRGTLNRGRHQVAQSWLNRLYGIITRKWLFSLIQNQPGKYTKLNKSYLK